MRRRGRALNLSRVIEEVEVVPSTFEIVPRITHFCDDCKWFKRAWIAEKEAPFGVCLARLSNHYGHLLDPKHPACPDFEEK